MKDAIEFTTQRYEQAHHRKPRGYRLWYFSLPGDSTFSFAGTYTEAKRAAAAVAIGRCRSSPARIHVCA